MLRRFLIIVAVIVAGWSTTGIAAHPNDSSNLLRVREAVWRSWFDNDAKTLRELVPPETIVISAGEKQWKHQAAVLQSAAEFRAQGGKLIRLEFPRTEIQQFGEVAIYIASTVLKRKCTANVPSVPGGQPKSSSCTMANGPIRVGTPMRKSEERAYSNTRSIASTSEAKSYEPSCLCPLMKKVGVPLTPLRTPPVKSARTRG
jgi:hypothetical protein